MKLINSYTFVLLFVLSGIQLYAVPKTASSADLKFCREEGIFSENRTIRKASLFMIFEAEDNKALPYLIERLNEEPEHEFQALIARVILKLSKVEGIRALEKFALKEGNFQVRWICRSICKEYAENNSEVYSFNSYKLDELLKSEISN